MYAVFRITATQDGVRSAPLAFPTPAEAEAHRALWPDPQNYEVREAEPCPPDFWGWFGPDSWLEVLSVA